MATKTAKKRGRPPGKSTGKKPAATTRKKPTKTRAPKGCTVEKLRTIKEATAFEKGLNYGRKKPIATINPERKTEVIVCK